MLSMRGLAYCLLPPCWGEKRQWGTPGTSLHGSATFSLLSVLVCLSPPVCLCVCPILFPSSCPLMEASWKLTVWDRTSLYILWPQWPLPSYSGLENDLKASCTLSLQCDFWITFGVTEEGQGESVRSQGSVGLGGHCIVQGGGGGVC